MILLRIVSSLRSFSLVPFPEKRATTLCSSLTRGVVGRVEHNFRLVRRFTGMYIRAGM